MEKIERVKAMLEQNKKIASELKYMEHLKEYIYRERESTPKYSGNLEKVSS